MTGSVLLATLAGSGAGAGVLLLRTALQGGSRHPASYSRLTRRLTGSRWIHRRTAAGCLVGVVVTVATRWPVAGIAAAALVIARPHLTARTPARTISRLEALASWTESLRDVVAGGIGLEQAIELTARTAQPGVATELGMLAGRLRAHRPLPEALRRLAGELDDGTADRVIAALLVAADARGPGLVAVLDRLAAATREQVSARRQIDASRRPTHRAVQVILGLAAVTLGCLFAVNPAYLDVYRAPLGQLLLAAAAGLSGAGLVWIRHLERVDAPTRYFQPADPGGAR